MSKYKNIIATFDEEERIILNTLVYDMPQEKKNFIGLLKFYLEVVMEEEKKNYEMIIEKLNKLSQEDYESIKEYLPFQTSIEYDLNNDDIGINEMALAQD